MRYSFPLFILFAMTNALFGQAFEGLSLRPAIAWYTPSLSHYNDQYEGVSQDVFPNDVANFFRIPKLATGRELGFGFRFRVIDDYAFGLAVSNSGSDVRVLLSDPSSSDLDDPQNYSHEVDLMEVSLSAHRYFAISKRTAIVIGQAVGLVIVKENVKVSALDRADFTDRSRSLALLFAPSIGVEQTLAEQTFVFLELSYLLGGYTAQDWQQPLDPNKSTFLRRGTVSLYGPRIRLGVGFSPF